MTFSNEYYGKTNIELKTYVSLRAKRYIYPRHESTNLPTRSPLSRRVCFRSMIHLVEENLNLLADKIPEYIEQL